MYDYTTQSRDEIILAMVGTGMSLNKATKEYVKGKKEAGLSTGVTSYKTEAFEYLDTLDLSGEVDVAPLIEHLTVTHGVKPDTARNYVMAHGEENGYTVKSKLASEAILDWIVDNAPLDAGGDWDGFDLMFKDWMTDQGKSASNINEYRKGIRLHRALLAR
jgi:hypothetical protein